jgi:quinol monooxygenase YgiN
MEGMVDFVIVSVWREDATAGSNTTTSGSKGFPSGLSYGQTFTAGVNVYGLIGKMRAVAGQRDELIAVLLDGVAGMPGCHSYIVARDPSDADAIWITEVWDNQDSHKGSLKLPSVQAAIAKGRPMIAGFESHVETEPVGGHGLRT